MIAEQVDSLSDPMPSQDDGPPLARDTQKWSASNLLDAVDRLCLLYSLPLLDRAQGPVMAEAQALAAMGLAPTVYLASATACAIRVSFRGPAIAFGRWSGSAILAHLLATIPAIPVEPELFMDAAPGPSDLSPDWGAQPPVFLIAEDPDSTLPGMLADDPLLREVGITESAGSFSLTATMTMAPMSESAAPSALAAPPLVVGLRPSRLLRVVRDALSLVERETGARPMLGGDNAPWSVSGSVPPAEWLARLPEVPVWAISATAYGATAAETASLWLQLAPAPPSVAGTAALRVRAHLAHALVACASRWPTLEWTTLLDVSPRRAAGIEAAANAGDARGSMVGEPVTLQPLGSIAALGSGSVIGHRMWRHGSDSLAVLAVDLGEGRLAHAVVANTAVTRAGGGGVPSLVVTRSAEATEMVWVEAALVVPVRPVIEILVPLLGDKERDLDRLGRVWTVLEDHKGDADPRLVLTRGAFRRVLDPGEGHGVAWSGALVDALELLLGFGCARLVD